MKTLALVLVLVLCAYATQAAVPHTMSYQGILRDSYGNVVPDGSHSLTFSIYDVDGGGTPLWSESQMLPVEGGIVNAILGHSVPLDLPFGTTYWLGITIDDDLELFPRTELTSAPYALHAAYADEGAADGDWTIDGEDVYRLPGNVGIGLPTPTARLDVVGTVKMTGFQLTDAPAPGRVLMSDATGVGTWQPAAGTVGGGGTVDYVPKFYGPTTIGNSVIYETSGRVSIGTTTSDAKLRVESAGNLPTLRVESTSAGHGFSLVELSRTEPMDQYDDLLTLVSPVDSYPGFSYISCIQLVESGWHTPFSVSGNGNIWTEGNIQLDCDELWGIHAMTGYGHNDAAAVKGVYVGGPFDGKGVHGTAATVDYYGYGGYFQGGYMGVYGEVEPTGSDVYHAVHGSCDGGSGTNYGVFGTAGGAGLNFGVYGSASGGAGSWAGWFQGDTMVTGTFSNPSSAFKIDHPLDPGGQFLSHPAVHSSEMKNVYDGVVMLDAYGEAWVELPDWFEALNTSFRYQLTAIGAPGPNLYVAEKISGDRFGIAGGDPGMEVSWQVTGVRHDPVAEQYGIQVEERKSDREMGKYLRPEAYGASEEMGIGFSEAKEPGH